MPYRIGHSGVHHPLRGDEGKDASLTDGIQPFGEEIVVQAVQRKTPGRAQLMQYQMRFQYLNPEAKLRDNRQRLADLDELLRRAMKNRIAEERHMLGIYLERYRGLSPLYKLNQGYSFVSDREGNGIISTKQVHSGDLLEISVTDGVIEAEVRSSRKEDWNK